MLTLLLKTFIDYFNIKKFFLFKCLFIKKVVPCLDQIETFYFLTLLGDKMF